MTGAGEFEAGVIAALTESGRRDGRVHVAFEGGKGFQVSATVVAERGLHVGQLVTASELEAIGSAERLARATDRALAFLSYRPRSVREVRDRLYRHGVEPDIIDAVLARLAGWGYVGDESFAAYWVENRTANQPRGKRLIEQELRRKGVGREAIAVALNGAEINEPDAVVELARARLERLRGLDLATRRRRLIAFLARRGYEYDTVRGVVDALLTVHAGGDPELDGECADADKMSEDSDSYAFDGEPLGS